MKAVPLPLPGLLRIEPVVHGDARGFFLERFRQDAWEALGLPRFVQDNHSRSARGVLRGLHYQLPPSGQGKLVGVVRGAILDVAVDLRRGSPGFGRWTAEVLSDQDAAQLWVPEGFAHGFVVLSEVADVLYKVTSPYDPAADRGVRWDDPELGIDWRLDELGGPPLLSAKDRAQPLLVDADLPWTWDGSAHGGPDGGPR